MKPTHLASLAAPIEPGHRDAAHGAADRGHQEEIIHGVVVHFAQEQLLEIALAEAEDQGEAGQDDEGKDHDPGHAVVFVVAVAMPMGVSSWPWASSSTWTIWPGTLL